MNYTIIDKYTISDSIEKYIIKKLNKEPPYIYTFISDNELNKIIQKIKDKYNIDINKNIIISIRSSFIKNHMRYEDMSEMSENPNYVYYWLQPRWDFDMETKNNKFYAELERMIDENTYDKILFENDNWVKETYKKRYQDYLFKTFNQIYKLKKVYKSCYALKRD